MERFWSKVERQGADECWPWKAARAPGGYGMFRVGGKGSGTTSAHRVAFALTHGGVPSDAVVCHTCDNRACCNPAHLFVGAQADNIRDMVGKGRHARARRLARKLSQADVQDIRARRAAGEYQQDLADAFGVSRDWIGKIVRGEWRKDG